MEVYSKNDTAALSLSVDFHLCSWAHKFMFYLCGLFVHYCLCKFYLLIKVFIKNIYKKIEIEVSEFPHTSS